MNIIWGVMILGSLIFGAMNGTLTQTVDAGINGAKDSISVVLSFAGVMCMWSGIMRLCDKGGISGVIEKMLVPVTRILFPKLKDKDVKKSITMNITANILGMGNAATPLGIEAMQKLDKKNTHPERASKDMCMFVVLNTASFQLVPTTILALRASGGSLNASEIILPIWIVSAISVVVAVIMVKIFYRGSKK